MYVIRIRYVIHMECLLLQLCVLRSFDRQAKSTIRTSGIVHAKGSGCQDGLLEILEKASPI